MSASHRPSPPESDATYVFYMRGFAIHRMIMLVTAPCGRYRLKAVKVSTAVAAQGACFLWVSGSPRW